MRWEYSSLSLLMWASFVLYGLITVGLFVLIARNRNKRQSFNLSAAGLVGIHVLLLVVLGFNSSASNSSRVGFEVWVCGRQVELKASSVVSKFKSLNDARFSSDKTLIVNGEESKVKLLESLESAGLSANLDKSGLNIPVSRSFELKASSNGSLSWLSDSVKYSGSSGAPTLEVASGEVVCPYGGSDEWNIFVARINNKDKTYFWERVYFNQLPTLTVGSSDGGDLSDCVVFDYGPKKATTEHRCVYLLKNDSERCPEIDKTTCKYREVDPV